MTAARETVPAAAGEAVAAETVNFEAAASRRAAWAASGAADPAAMIEAMVQAVNARHKTSIGSWHTARSKPVIAV